jgi:hypothetical protein
VKWYATTPSAAHSRNPSSTASRFRCPIPG